MNDFEDAFNQAANQAAASAASSQGDAYVASVADAIEDAWNRLQAVGTMYQNNPEHSLKGLVAEVHHAGSFNIDAARRGLEGRHAEVLQSHGLDSADVRVSGPSGTHDFQFKYLKIPGETAKDLSRPGYAHMGKVAPAEQVDAVRDAAAARANRIAEHRPDQAAHLSDTSARVTDRVSCDGAESRSLDSEEALRMARDIKQGRLAPEDHNYTIEQNIHWGDVGRAAAQSGLTAAVISAALGTVPHLWRTLEIGFKEGRLSTEDLELAMMDGGRGAMRGALRGAIAGGLVTACKAGLLGEAAKSLDPTGIGAATAVAISLIGDSIRLARGEITAAVFADRCGRNVVAAAASVVGAGIGQALIPVPVLGAVIGSFVGSVLGTVGYEGAKAAFAALENSEGWEAQIGLAGAIAQLATSVRVVANDTTRLVELHDREVESLRAAGASWARQSSAIQEKLRGLDITTSEIHKRNDEQHERVTRLRNLASSK